MKKRLEKLGVNVSEVVRKFLEEYVKRVERSRLEDELREVNEELGGRIKPETIAKLVREDRERR